MKTAREMYVVRTFLSKVKALASPLVYSILAASAIAGIPSQYGRQATEWFRTDEGRRIADNVLTWQSPQGSWPKNGDTASRPYLGDKDKLAGTFDNGATVGELRFLAAAVEATGEARYRDAFSRGVDHILQAQYANGGWPQSYPPGRGYARHVTFNDGTMIGLMTFLRELTEGKTPFTFVDQERRDRAKAANARGIDCILKTQIKQGGKLTAWCSQHDEKTLAPAWARAYEPPSLSGSESVGIVRFLMSVREPSPEVVAAIEGAVQWFESVAIRGVRIEEFKDPQGRRDRRIVPDPKAGPLWARFYELGSKRPIFLDRDSVVRYSLAEIGQERRGGYAWYGNWPEKLIRQEYPRWQSMQHKPGDP